MKNSELVVGFFELFKKTFFTDDSDSQLGLQCQTANKTIDLNDQVSPQDHRSLTFIYHRTYKLYI